jgi:hypothetical protein
MSQKDKEAEVDVQLAWAEEAERRAQAYDDGKTNSRDWRESIQDIREDLQKRRPSRS